MLPPRLAPIRRTTIWGTWSVEVTAGSPLILRRECGAVYPVGVVVNLVAAAGGGNGTRTGWLGVVAAVSPVRAKRWHGSRGWHQGPTAVRHVHRIRTSFPWPKSHHTATSMLALGAIP